MLWWLAGAMPSVCLRITPMLEIDTLSNSSTPRTPSPRASTRRGTAAKAEANIADATAADIDIPETETPEAVKPKRVRKPKIAAEDDVEPVAKPRAPRKTKAAALAAEAPAAEIPLAATSAAKPARVKGCVYTAEEMVAAVVTVIDDAKGEEIIALDLFGKTTIADAMIVASGRSERHVGAIAERIASTLKDMGQPAPKIEGMTACDWVLIDTGDIIVHLFRPEVRGFYNLEKLWGAGRPSEGALPEPKLAGPAKPSKPIKIKAEGATTPRKPRRKAESV